MKSRKLAKRMTLLLALALCFSLMAGAFAEEVDPMTIQPANDYGGITIRIGDPWGIATLEPGQNDRTDRILERIAQVEAKYNVKIELVRYPDDYVENTVAAIMAGEPYAELMFAQPWFMMGYYQAGAMKDLTDLGLNFDDPVLSQVAVDHATILGRNYGFLQGSYGLTASTAGSITALVFNKRLLDEAGLEYPYELVEKGEWTFDAFRKYAQTLTKDTDSDGITDQWGITAYSNGWELGLALIAANGGQIVDKNADPPRMAVGDPNAMEGMQFYYDLIHVDQTYLPQPENEMAGIETFIAGKSAFCQVVGWTLDTISGSALEDEYGIVPIPMGPKATDYRNRVSPQLFYIPVSVSDETAKAAFQVYCDLARTPYPELTLEEELENNWIGRCRDEESLSIMIDLGSGKYNVLDAAAGYGNFQWSFVVLLNDPANTPAYLVETNLSAWQTTVDDLFKK